MTDISLDNLQTDLIQASTVQPVLLDIWAPWCGPCKALGPLLEKLEVAYAGRFVLAKLDADQQPDIAGQLSQMFGTRSIPLCVLFKDGQPVDGFVGALPESEIRAFLDRHVPAAEDIAAEAELGAAEELLSAGDSDSAIERLQDAVAMNPANDAARNELLRALLRAGRVAEAQMAFEPVASQVVPDPRLVACGHWIAACTVAESARSPEQLAEAITANKRDFAARFEQAQVHFAAARHTEAMDALLEIVMRDKTWQNELARKTYVAILDVMAKPAPKPDTAPAAKGALELSGRIATTSSDPVVDQYRRKLSMALF